MNISLLQSLDKVVASLERNGEAPLTVKMGEKHVVVREKAPVPTEIRASQDHCRLLSTLQSALVCQLLLSLIFCEASDHSNATSYGYRSIRLEKSRYNAIFREWHCRRIPAHSPELVESRLFCLGSVASAYNCSHVARNLRWP